MKKILFSGLALLSAAPALAHPGHDAPPVTHWVADGAHLAVVGLLAALVIVAGGAILARLRSPARRRKSE